MGNLSSFIAGSAPVRQRAVAAATAALALFIGLLAPTALTAQDTSSAAVSRHLISLSTGLSSHALRDDIISPLVYSGSQIPALFAYDYRAAEVRQTAMFFYDFLSLSSSITKASSHYADEMNFILEYAYGRRAFSFGKLRTDCFLGAGTSFLLNSRTFHYVPNKGSSSGESMINVGLDASFETMPNPSSPDMFSLHFFIPAVSYVLLNDRYNVSVSETFLKMDPDKEELWWVLTHGSVVTIDRMFELQGEVSYTKYLTQSVAFRAQYRFMYYSYAQFERLFFARYLNNQILAGLVVQL